MAFIKKDGGMYVDVNCNSIYGPTTLRFNVDPTPGKRLRRILSVSAPNISALAEFTGLINEISTRPAENLAQGLFKQQCFSLAIDIMMAELSRGE